MRIVERALRDMPRGPVQVHPETGRPIPAAEMVDLAKVGNIVAIADDSAVTCPTLEGSGRAEHPSIATDEKRVFLPPKEDTYGNIEGLMQQFKLVMFGHGVRPPKGEVYFPVEGANGELGFLRGERWNRQPIPGAGPSALLCDHVGPVQDSHR